MLKDEILRLKQAKDAVILAHFYQYPEVQDIADYVGDSLDLSRVAEKASAKIIVFCGVNFMAETAKILSPDKKVLLPAKDAGCPMAMMISKTKLLKYKEQHPNRKVICYVNSYADVKALSDVCVTSSNAEKIIMHFKDEKMLYIPDYNLGNYLKDRYQLDIDLWPGHCLVHNRLVEEDVLKMKALYPKAEVLIHPEAPLAVLKLADYVGSTRGILNRAKASCAKEFIIGTEEGILHPLRKENPDKEFYVLHPSMVCRNMKKTTLKEVYEALLNEQYEITIEEEIRLKAKQALDLMLELS
ncbi:MAG: quinolinate synthase NadA [Candidatus Izemoplasmatales bacterium]|nr:quinolinate synthase NadA [Candidatus Izemoplasmatales bacterium]